VEAVSVGDRFEAVTKELRDSPKRWLVTGGAGFVGSHLVEWLLGNGQHVTVLDDFSTGRESNLEDVGSIVGDEAWSRCELLVGDIRDPSMCRRACEGVDYVLHQAALGSVPRSIAYPEQTHEVNVNGTVNVLLAARDTGVKTVVYASSSSVYGDHPGLPKKEEEIGRPLSPYAVSKRVGEIYAEVYWRVYGLRTIGLRYFNVVGARQDPEGPYAAVVPRWIAALSKCERPVIYGDGETSRDFCPVANVVQANVLAATAGEEAMGGVYNIALGERTTLLELFAMLRDAVAAGGVPCENVEPVFEPFRPGDIRHSLADVQDAIQAIGYTARVGVKDALQALLENRVCTGSGVTSRASPCSRA
jgi:UDP-N-acetylglucosamine 4-epimerase